MAKTVDVPMYVQIEPRWRTYRPDFDNPNHVEAAAPIRLTKKSPESPAPGVVVVKLLVRMPTSIFVALQPEAVIEIPEELCRPVPIEVQAGDPNREDSEG